MNSRLKRVIDKYGDEIEDGTWLDCYGCTINKKVCGTILTGIDYRNLYFIAVKENESSDKE